MLQREPHADLRRAQEACGNAGGWRQRCGAPDRSRTCMGLLPADFKSAASTSSATGAGRKQGLGRPKYAYSAGIAPPTWVQLYAPIEPRPRCPGGPESMDGCRQRRQPAVHSGPGLSALSRQNTRLGPVYLFFYQILQRCFLNVSTFFCCLTDPLTTTAGSMPAV